jgi:hypothetical protein
VLLQKLVATILHSGVDPPLLFPEKRNFACANSGLRNDGGYCIINLIKISYKVSIIGGYRVVNTFIKKISTLS